MKELNKMATEMVGDGKSPNLFFVSVGSNVKMITRDFQAAYQYWKSLPTNIETMLEDRKYGVISDTSPIEDGSTTLRTYDDSYMFLKDHPHYRKSFVVDN